MIDQQKKLGPLMVFGKLDLRIPASISLLKRLENYAKAYVSFSSLDADSLSILGIRKLPDNVDEKDFPNLSILDSNGNLFLEFFKIVSYYREKSGIPGVIIAGDPWFGFLKCYFLKKFFFKESLVQIQFHGDIYTLPKPWHLKETFKYLIVKQSLATADSIRVVSDFQIGELRPFVSKSVSFVCAPIPLDIEKIPREVNGGRQGIGLVGRLHKERGLDIFLSILKELKAREIKSPIFIVGNGPSKKPLLGEIENLGLAESVFFVGGLNNLELRDFYSKLKILLSCAPSEGYGLTIREAALSGIQIVARKSKGTLTAKNEYFAEINLYNSVSQAVNIIEELLQREEVEFNNLARIQMQMSKDQDLIDQWVRTWILLPNM